MYKYEIVIYNEAVRKLVKQGDRHRRYSDDWGDSHYIEFTADSEEQAVAKCRQKYPVEDGFVIEGISMV
jgi:hypothetical protein